MRPALTPECNSRILQALWRLGLVSRPHRQSSAAVENRFFEDAPAANDRKAPSGAKVARGIAPAKPTGDNTEKGANMGVIVTVPIPDDLLSRLEQKARKAGMDRDQYVRGIVARELEGPRPLDEILRDFRNEAAASGMSDEELLNPLHCARSTP
jgi:hypothetical protein